VLYKISIRKIIFVLIQIVTFLVDNPFGHMWKIVEGEIFDL